MNSPTDTLAASLAADRSAPEAAAWPRLGRHLLLIGQLAVAAVVIYAYNIEGTTFLRLFLLATAGAAVNLVLPVRFRLKFFVGLSLAGAALTFGIADAAWLVATGLVLIGLCHLPIPLKARVAVLLLAAGALAASRGGWIGSPWSAAVWPILGSMFMFRLVLYLWTIKSGKDTGGVWSALAYFFMLPNLVFPLFPVVDYQTFLRTHYDRDEHQIHELGLLWIARGLLHLLLYRFIYHSVLNDPVDVVSLGDLVQFLLGTLLLYLRVSGQFHLVVGMLHVFGFRLPETHKLYYLSHSFTELWRRINIYWTDFMMKTVFYPTYFKVKRLGPTKGLVIATAAVFVTTWVLHSYQWFWLRGGFPLTVQDTSFWALLYLLVIVGALREAKATKKPRARHVSWSLRLGLQAMVTFSLFCFLWSWWSTESAMQWLWMLGAAGNVDTRGVVLLAVTLLTILALGGRDWDAPATDRPQWMKAALLPATRAAAWLVVMLIAAVPALREASPPVLAASLTALKTTGLNQRDEALKHRGYYEQLEVRPQAGAEAGQLAARENWIGLSGTGILRLRQDWLLRDLAPSRSVLWNGKRFTTNRWGMRDRDYAQAKPADTLRIALLGPSHVMGNGVADGETFETLVEDRLNREFSLDAYTRVEILNFAVDGYSLPQQVAMLEDRVLAFAPDVVIATHYLRNRAMTEGFLVNVAENDLTVPAEIDTLLERAGLATMDHGAVPVPFAAGRRLAKWLGLPVRMPTEESEARARRIADATLEASFLRLARLGRERGFVPAILALDAVIDDEPATVPQADSIRNAGLPVLDLYGVYPPADRPALRIAPWDDHPNAAGHRLIADRLYPQLTAFLGSHVGHAPAGTLSRSAASPASTLPRP